MSKWKTVRKDRLEEFARYKNNRGWIGGFTATWAGLGLAKMDVGLLVLALLAYAVYWLYGYRYEDYFTRIRDAIDDAGGENQH